MKSERMKTGGVGWGAGGKVRLLQCLWEPKFGEHNGKFSIICLLLSFSRGKQQRQENKDSKEERRDSDFVNIFSAKSLDLRPSKLNGIRCCAFNLRQERKSKVILSVNVDVYFALPIRGSFMDLVVLTFSMHAENCLEMLDVQVYNKTL